MKYMKIPVTNNWVSNMDGIIGHIEFADTARAIFVYEMLKMRPDSFKFEIGYSVDTDGKYHLHEVSLVNKYPKYHPIIIKRQLKDKIVVGLRKAKKAITNATD